MKPAHFYPFGSRRGRPQPVGKVPKKNAWALIGALFVFIAAVALLVGFVVSSTAVSPLDLL